MTRNRCQLTEGHTHRADGQDPWNFCDDEGPGPMGERVVRRGVGERLPANTTYRSRTVLVARLVGLGARPSFRSPNLTAHARPTELL